MQASPNKYHQKRKSVSKMYNTIEQPRKPKLNATMFEMRLSDTSDTNESAILAEEHEKINYHLQEKEFEIERLHTTLIALN